MTFKSILRLGRSRSRNDENSQMAVEQPKDKHKQQHARRGAVTREMDAMASKITRSRSLHVPPLHPINVNVDTIANKFSVEAGLKNNACNVPLASSEQADNPSISCTTGVSEQENTSLSNSRCPGRASEISQGKQSSLSSHTTEVSEHETTSPSSTRSTEVSSQELRERPVIWSNPAFCTDVTRASMGSYHPGDASVHNQGTMVQTPILAKKKSPKKEHSETEDDDDDEMDKKIELLTKQLAELRARRDAKFRAKQRALSCPPTPNQDSEASERTTPSRKGWMVSAKYRQSPGGEPSGRRASDQRDGGLPRTAKGETTPVTMLRGKAGGKRVTTGSLDETFIEKMQNLMTVQQPACNTPASVRRMEWAKSLRYRAMERGAEKKLSSGSSDSRDGEAEVKPSETQALLNSIKEIKAGQASPAVTKKVRVVASRYNESPTFSARKKSLEGPSPMSAQRSVGRGSPAVLSRSRTVSNGECVSGGSHACTPSKGVARKDGLELERNMLPRICIKKQQAEHCSPRDSGCVKRPAAANKSSFFSTTKWDDSF